MEALSEGILSGDRASLGRALTLLESERPQDKQTAQELLLHLAPHRKESLRIGITGPPGIGKSTFIDGLGTALVEQGHRVAVLAVDPSSQISGGSILGDKTRMQRLSGLAQAFVRPSASRGRWGGVSAGTGDQILLCEAAGYTRILIETVGVGQSETEIKDLCDLTLVLGMPGTGDELQGIKRGIMEIPDVVVLHKVDLFSALAVAEAKEQLRAVLSPSVPVFTVSSLVMDSLKPLLDFLDGYTVPPEKREQQSVARMESLFQAYLGYAVEERTVALRKSLQEDVRAKRMLPEEAARLLMASLKL